MIVFTVVFSVLMPNNKIEKYPIFLLCGLLAWNYFSSSVMSGTNCIVANSNLVKKVYFPREILPIATVLANLVNFLLALLVLFAVLLVFRANFSPWLWLLPAVILIQTGFTLGVVFFLSTIQVYYRDTLLMLDVLMLAWFFLTPVFYAVSFLPTSYTVLGVTLDVQRLVYILNPMASLINMYRDLLDRGYRTERRLLLANFHHGAADSWSGILVFRPVQRQLRRRGLKIFLWSLPRKLLACIYSFNAHACSHCSCAASSRRIRTVQAQLAPFEAGTMMSYPLPASPEDLAVESANHLWFTLPTANAIGSVEVSSLDDNVQYRYASYAVPTGGSSPQQLVISNGVVWFTEQGANKSASSTLVAGHLLSMTSLPSTVVQRALMWRPTGRSGSASVALASLADLIQSPPRSMSSLLRLPTLGWINLRLDPMGLSGLLLLATIRS